MKKPSEISVLVVDDDADVSGAIEAIFKTFGFKTTTAGNGKIAWETMQSSDFDVVLSDIRMPISDGVELLKKIRARNVTSPCVLMASGYTDYPNEVLYNHGANAIFAKPFRAASVRDAVQRAMQKPEEFWAIKSTGPFDANLEAKLPLIDLVNASKTVKFGRGGFFFANSPPDLSVGSLVTFDLKFETGTIRRIEGQGVVRWIRSESDGNGQPGAGIEVKYFSESCRVAFADWVLKQNLTPYIPIN